MSMKKSCKLGNECSERTNISPVASTYENYWCSKDKPDRLSIAFSKAYLKYVPDGYVYFIPMSICFLEYFLFSPRLLFINFWLKIYDVSSDNTFFFQKKFQITKRYFCIYIYKSCILLIGIWNSIKHQKQKIYKHFWFIIFIR